MRKITREKVMKLLYIVDIHRQANKIPTIQEFIVGDEALEFIERQEHFLLNKKDDRSYFKNTFSGILQHLTAIDTRIEKYVKQGWSLQQLGVIERALLRIAIYELYWSEEEGLSPEVVVSSTINLATMFTDDASVKFLHGLLGASIGNVTKTETTRPKAQGYQKIDTKFASQNQAALKKFKEQKKKQAELTSSNKL